MLLLIFKECNFTDNPIKSRLNSFVLNKRWDIVNVSAKRNIENVRSILVLVVAAAAMVVAIALVLVVAAAAVMVVEVALVLVVVVVVMVVEVVALVVVADDILVQIVTGSVTNVIRLCEPQNARAAVCPQMPRLPKPLNLSEVYILKAAIRLSAAEL